jgi:hypothetical protein
VNRLGQRGSLPAAVAVGDHIRREECEESLLVAVPCRFEESPCELLASLPRRLEPRTFRLHVASRPSGDLPAVVLAPLDDLRDLLVAVVEDLAKEEHSTLDGREVLEKEQEGHGKGVGRLRMRNRVFLFGHDRFWQPRSHVALSPHARRSQVVDRQPGRDRRQVRLRRVDLGPRRDLAVVPEEGLLGDVFRVARAAHHAIGNREH